MSRPDSHAAIRTASALARSIPTLATLERERPGHGAAELARRVKDACPDASKAACRRAADEVLGVRLGQSTHRGVMSRASCCRPLAVNPAAARHTPSRATGRTPKETIPLSRRLADHKWAMAREAFETCGFRHSRAWDDAGRFLVEAGSPSAVQSTDEGWIDYKSHGYRKGIVGETVRLTLPADWGTRVRLAGLANLDGLFTLDAERLPTDGCVEVYRAAWARQGRGVTLVVERGYIARHTPSGTTFHSTNADPEKALAGLRRKLNLQAIPAGEREAMRAGRSAARALRRAAQLARLLDRLARWDLADIGHVPVTRGDSLKAGNCAPGTDTFIDRHGFDGRESATIGEIAEAVGRRDIAGLGEADLTLARQLAAACLQAVRRDKAARRLIGA